MTIADPRTYAVTKKKDDETVDEHADLRAQLAALSAQVQMLTQSQVQSGGGITAEQLKEVMTGLVKVQADAHTAAMREIAERDQRDDLNYPRISVYSYPEGDKANPRPPFKCRIFWNGFDMDWDTTTAYEIELLNRVEPGNYTFRRVDGRTPEKITVNGERNALGQLSKLEFFFPTKENRDTLPSMASMLRDILHVGTPEQERIAELERQIARLHAKEPVSA
jgi:polyhydroxyalkanoate synthesis regulator phasin